MKPQRVCSAVLRRDAAGWSARPLVLLEVLVVPKRSGRVDLCQRYREIFDAFPNLRMQPVGEEIAEIASDLRARYSIKPPDAIHVAGAIAAGADAFISQDGNLKKICEIPVRSLNELSLS